MVSLYSCAISGVACAILTENVRLIGSVVFTVPAAGWLLQQGPKTTSDHGHGEGEPHEVTEEAPAEESEEEPKEEGEEESKDDDKEDNADKKSGGTTEPEEYVTCRGCLRRQLRYILTSFPVKLLALLTEQYDTQPNRLATRR